MTPLLKWEDVGNLTGQRQWNLVLRRVGKQKSRVVATIWANGTWHTWDHNGIGGENDIEETWQKAKIEATASAIAQGFV